MGSLVTEKKLHGLRENQKDPLRRCQKQKTISLHELLKRTIELRQGLEVSVVVATERLHSARPSREDLAGSILDSPSTRASVDH